MVQREILRKHSLTHSLEHTPYWLKFIGYHNVVGPTSYLMNLSHDFLVFNKF